MAAVCLRTLYFFGIGIFLTVAAWGQSPLETSQPIRDVERLGQQLSDTAYWYRAQAAMRLSDMGDKARPATEQLLNALNDDNPDVRLRVLHALGMIAEPSASTINRIASKLRDSDEHVRYAAQWALTRLAILGEQSNRLDNEIVQALERAFQNLGRQEHHQGHYEALGKVLASWRDEKQARELKEHLAEQARLEREQAEQNAQAAAQAALQKAAELQTANLQRSRSWELKLADKFAISSRVQQLLIIRQLANASPSFDRQDAMQDILRSAYLSNDMQAIQYAHTTWKNDALEASNELLLALPTTNAAYWVSSLVADVHPQSFDHLTKLRDLAHSEDEAIRYAAIEAMGNTQANSPAVSLAFTSLYELVNQRDADSFQRCAAVESLDKLAHMHAELSLQAAFLFSTLVQQSQEEWVVRLAAARGLSHTASNRAIAQYTLLQAINELEPSDYNRIELIDCLGALEPLVPEAVEIVLSDLDAGDEYVWPGLLQVLSKAASIDQHIALHLEKFILEKQSAVTVHAELARILSRSPAPESTVLRMLNSTEPYAVETGALIACQMDWDDSSQAIQALSHAISDPTIGFRTTHVLLVAISKLLPQSNDHAKQFGVEILQKILASDCHNTLRASALLGLAETQNLSDQQLAAATIESSEEILAIVAQTKYRRGDLAGLNQLISMLAIESSSEYAEAALIDCGANVVPAVYSVAESIEYPASQRIAGIRTLLRMPYANKYGEIAELISDSEIGEEAGVLLTDEILDHGDEILKEMVNELTYIPFNDHESLARYERVFESMTDGLGAGGEDYVLETGSALGNRLALDVAFLEDELPAEALAMDSEIEAEEFPMPSATIPPTTFAPSKKSGSRDLNLQASPKKELPLTEFQMVPGTPDFSSFPVAPLLDASDNVADAPSPSDRATSDNKSASNEDLKRRVFFGTNRNRERFLGDSLAPALPLPYDTQARRLAAIGAAVAALSVCLFGFLRLRSATYSIFAVAGLIIVFYVGLRGNLIPWGTEPSDNIVFGGEFDQQMTLGVCEVTLPPGHVRGEIESPSWTRFEFRPDPKKHVILAKTEELNADAFMHELKNELDTQGNSLLVFVHGYNVSFSDAARRTAQMAYDLEYPGAAAFFSWPSDSNWYAYQSDRRKIELSVDHIKQFLHKLLSESGAESINLIAHSMGNVGLTQALAELETEASQTLFNQVVLAAPDIDAQLFRDRIAPKIVTKANHVTVYTSATDLALIASKYFNSGRRLGDSSEETEISGIDFIDATSVDSSLLGHSYYGSNVSVLQDIAELFAGQPINQRRYLQIEETEWGPRWEFSTQRIATTPITTINH
ncbi:MAG: alpha/beta hydrolase [Planctomycetales bacterium]|nr:alpha/beta hydrolase [Planctomycetales bacterium]